MTARMRLWAALLGLVLGVLALGPALRPGFTLSYDMVFVPHPAFTKGTFGLTGVLPRNVPSDAVVTALSAVLPAALVQKLILLAIFVMACLAAAELTPGRLVPRLAAGAVYAWNPFVAERLLLGQWALLLGYAALPWVVLAAWRGAPGPGLLRALVPAAIGGFAALAVSGLVVLVVSPRKIRAAGVLLLAGLPWLATGLLRPRGLGVDPAGVAAFAARADTPFGTLGSLLLLGGAWNSETVPPGYGAALTAAAWLVVVLAAISTYALCCRTPWARRLGIAAGIGFVLAALGVVAPRLLERAMDALPVLAVLRDGQQFVAPLAVVVAAGFGVALDRIRFRELAVLGIAVPIALLPALAWGASGRLQSVHYPADWAAAKRIIDGDPEPGAVLLLPWAAYRSYDWNGGRRVLDPLPRYLERRVVWNDGVVVGRIRLAAEDPRARALRVFVRDTLLANGIRYVVIDSGSPAFQATPILRGRDITVYRLDGEVARVREHAPRTVVAVLAWSVWCAGILWSFVAPRITLVNHFPQRRRS